MTITFDVAIKNTEHEYEEIKVEFEGEPTWEDDSYSDEFGLVKRTPYPSMTQHGDPTWDESKYTPEQNEIIKDWYNENIGYVSDYFCQKLYNITFEL